MLTRFILLALLGAFFTPTFAANEPLTADLTGDTGDGYTIEIFSKLSPLQINQIHSWLINIKDSAGNAVDNAAITVTGGMPEHDHGIPTSPQITGRDSEGLYILEGVRFHMPGKWQLVITLDIENNAHTAVIDFQL
jgi:hypothetical protein